MAINLRANVNASDVVRLRRRLDPIEMGLRVRAGMTESLQYLQGQVQTHMAVDSSRGRTSVQVTPVTGTLLPNLRGEVGSSEVHVIVMELGRRPGSRMPPPGPINLWLTRHGLPLEMSWPLRRRIARRGIRGWGLHMFRNAAHNGRRVIRSIVIRHLRAGL